MPSKAPAGGLTGHGGLAATTARARVRYRPSDPRAAGPVPFSKGDRLLFLSRPGSSRPSRTLDRKPVGEWNTAATSPRYSAAPRPGFAEVTTVSFGVTVH